MRALEKKPHTTLRLRRGARGRGASLPLFTKPVHAGPPSGTYRLRKFMRRHKVPVLAVTAIVVIIIAATAVTMTATLNSLRIEKKRAEKDRRSAHRAETGGTEGPGSRGGGAKGGIAGGLPRHAAADNRPQ